ncbi:MAG: glycosyltransferase family 4 protein [Gemmatimonadaceae bacterium]
MRPRCCFVVESGTDVRMVDGLTEHFDVSIIARRITGGVEVNWEPRVAVPTTIGPSSRAGFARLVWRSLRRRGGFDIVMVQGYGVAALVANVASRMSGTPTLMLVCSPVESYYRCRREHPEPGKPYRAGELAAARLLARVNGVVGRGYVVLSRHLAVVVRRHGTRRPVSVVPVYGIDTTYFTPAATPKTAIRAELGLPTTGALLFFSSRIAPEKDSETLLAAVRQLLDAGRDLWVLHRSGGYRAFLESARAVGVGERVIATDAVHPHRQLPRDYQATDLCVQASREEGLGFSPLEALACEVPVVATAVGGLRETIIDGETGWTYRAGDSVALAGAIEAALRDPAEARRRAANGRRMVCATYERALVFGRLEALVASRLRVVSPQEATRGAAINHA